MASCFLQSSKAREEASKQFFFEKKSQKLLFLKCTLKKSPRQQNRCLLSGRHALGENESGHFKEPEPTHEQAQQAEA